LIPVLLMFVYPGGPADAGPARGTDQRASDADRDLAADILCAAVGDARLTLDELDGRLGAALIADLPGRRSAPPPARPSDPAGRLGFGFPAPSRWSVIQALADARWSSRSPDDPPVGSRRS
jgi:hypothetical protein